MHYGSIKRDVFGFPNIFHKFITLILAYKKANFQKCHTKYAYGVKHY